MKLVRRFFICLVVVFLLICNIPTTSYASENNIVDKSTSEFYDQESGETITVVSVLSYLPSNNIYMPMALDEYSKVWTLQLLFYKGANKASYLGAYTVQFNHNYSPQRGYSEVAGIVYAGGSTDVDGYAIAGSYDIETKSSIRATATIINSKRTYTDTLTKKYVCYSSGKVKSYN